MQLSAEQDFWLPLSNPKSEQLDVIQTPVEIEVPKELPKVSLVKISFQKLKNHLASFDKVVKVRTTPDAITEGSWGFEHTKQVFKDEVIPFINYLRASFKYFENGLHSELNEVKMVFNQMEAVVEQCSVDKKYFDIQKKELSLDNDRLLDHIICQDVMNIVMHDNFIPVNVLSANHKCLIDGNLESDRLKQENDHLFELLLSQDIVHICVNSLATLTNYAKMKHDYIIEYSENLVLKAELAKKGTNGMKSSTSASRSQPSGNTKNNRILQTTSRNQRNKVEDYPRSVKTNSNKKNRVVEPVCNANVKHIMLNANSELICVKCNQCMFDVNHDVCFLEFVNDVNVRSKSKSAKSSKKKKTWKPTGIVFTDIGYRWKPTGWTFTIGLEVGSIWRIQGVGYGVLEFLGVGTTFDIFQNIHILYLEYGVLVFSGYSVLSLFPLWSLVKCKYVTRNTGKGRKNEENTDSYENLRYHGFVGYPFDYCVTLGFGSIAGGLDPANPIIRLPLEHGIIRAPGVVKPETRGNVNFEIKGQFMRELREYTIFGNKNEDAHDHFDRVLNIVSFLIFPEYYKTQYYYVCSCSLLLDRLKDGWIDSLQELSTLGTSLKRPLSKGIVHHPRSLNDLKTSPTSSRKALNRYIKLGNGLNIMSRQLLDSQGPIPGMKLTQALTAIQTMAEHSQKWHEGTSSSNISSSSDIDGLAAVISKLDNLRRDIKKLKENVHAIQVGC
ncbi:hypothetical protein Tco_1575926 [Tanacetum coccineum]